MKTHSYITRGVKCPICGAFVDTMGVSHSGPGGQWECSSCGWIGQVHYD